MVIPLKEFAPEGTATEKATKATQIGHLYMLQGFTYTLLAENYCSGLPIANANDQDPKTDILTTAQMFSPTQMATVRVMVPSTFRAPIRRTRWISSNLPLVPTWEAPDLSSRSTRVLARPMS